MIARAAASPPDIVVMHGIPRVIAAERISYPSVRAPVPTGVLITRSTSPRSMQSTTCGEPSPILLMLAAGIPIRRIDCAVPRVAMIVKPRSCSRLAMPVAAGLSLSATVRNTVPWLGSCAPAAACALANAVGKSAAIPITSPVDRISGPSSESAPAKRLNGSTASLTQTWPQVVFSGSSRSAIRSPSRIRQAILASGTPIALDTNGTVREARGLASITYRRSSPRIANWTLSRPTTPSARAIPVVCWAMRSSMSPPSVCGGSTQAESPEWIPASSTCCMIPAIQTSSPSQRASTSTSIESSRKRSR